MSDLRLPVEATRVDHADGRPPVWFVYDEAGRSEVDLHGDLRAAFVRLARSQELWPVWHRTMPLPDWPARIETEQIRQAAIARFEDAATCETEQSYTAEQRAEWDRWNDEGMREIAEANYKWSPR